MTPARPHGGYWLQEALAAEEAPPAPPLKRDAQADVIVVGGGYTGLWTAFFLTEREPGLDVVVLERGICGGGASGRNGGFLTGWWDELPELIPRYGEAAALAACRAVGESVEAIDAWCRIHRVDAWHTPSGYVGVSSSPAQDGAWSAAVQACRRLGAGEEYRELSPQEVRRVCASPAFRGGVSMPKAATVQPARLARGLRRVLLERGVRIHEGTPVRDLHPGRLVAAETPAGRVRAGRAVLAINAWAAAWPRLRRSLVVRGSHIVLTAPAPDRLEALGWTGGECIADHRTALHYFRTTPEGRLAFGGVGRARLGSRVGSRYDRDPASLRPIIRGLRRLFPSFADVPIADAWGGPIDVSALHHAMYGTLGPGTVHYGVGYSGNGVAPSHLGGRILAALALDATGDPVLRLPMVHPEPVRFPAEPFRSLGAALVQWAIMRTDRLEDEGRRPGVPTRLVAGLPRRLGYSLGPRP